MSMKKYLIFPFLYFIFAYQPQLAWADLVSDGRQAFEAEKYAEALQLWKKAAEQGDAEAQFNLAWMYGKGQGVLQDYSEAVKWFRLAAEQGHVTAQLSLALMYAAPRVLQDVVLALMWLEIAYLNGFEAAALFRDPLAAHMTPSQIEKAQNLARLCVESNYQQCN